MKHALLLLFALLSYRAALAQGGLPYKAGVGVANISPCSPSITANSGCKPDYIQLTSNVKNSGGNATTITSVESDLETRALLLEDAQGKRLALITLDVLALPPSFTPDVRQRLEALNIGLVGDNIILNASHTHSAPPLLDLSFNNLPDTNGSTTGIGPEEAPNAQYVEGVKVRIIAAVQQAIQQLEPVSLAVNTVQSSLATYRRPDAKLPNGQPYPQRLDVIQAKNATGQLVAVAYFFGCHPTTMYGLPSALSSDYPGRSRNRVETQLQASSPNVKALFFQGFGGDLQVGNSGVGAKNDAGDLLGTQVVAALQTPATALTGTLAVQTRTLNLSVDLTSVNWYNNGATSLPVELKEVQLATSAATLWTFLFCSHEVVSEYAANVRSNYAYPALVTLAGYSNFASSYLPTQRMMLTDPATCGLLPGGYEGCYSFRLYGRGRPSWKDDDFYAHQELPFDDFNDNVRDGSKWINRSYVQVNGQAIYDGLVPVAENNGQLIITPRPSVDDLHYNGYATVPTYNFTNQYASIELVQMPSATGAEFMLYVARDGANYYAFNVQQGQLRADKHVAGAVTYYPLGAYDPAQHRYLRIRHDGATDVIRWEASADSRVWTTLGSQPRELPLTAMRIELVGGTYQSASNIGSIILDNFRVPASLFTDDFNDNVRDGSKWVERSYVQVNGQAIYDSLVPVAENNGQLTISPLAGVNGLHYNGYATSSTYDFTNQYASIELVQTPSAAGAEFMLYVARDGANYYAFNVQQGQLRADKRVAGAVTYYPLGTYDPAQHRYLRIRHDGTSNLLLWETSADGQAWTTRFSQVQQLPVTTMRIELIGGTYQATGSPGVVVLDNFRLPIQASSARPAATPLSAGAAANPSIYTIYPNPATGIVTITYSMPYAEPVTLTLYDNTGRTVATLINEAQAAGNHLFTYNVQTLPQGVYFCRLTTAHSSVGQPLVVVK